MALAFMYYNFVRTHNILRVTPAMEAGIFDRDIWSLEEIAALADSLAAKDDYFKKQGVVSMISKYLFISDSGSRSYVRSLISLLGHLVGTGVIFIGLFSIGWIISFLLYGLNKIHPFPDEILNLITKIELYLVYVDTFLCAIVLLAGMLRFCKDIIWRQT